MQKLSLLIITDYIHTTNINKMDLQHILENIELTLEQQFSISALDKMNLDNVTKQQLLDVLVVASKRVHVLENLVKELFKEKL